MRNNYYTGDLRVVRSSGVGPRVTVECTEKRGKENKTGEQMALEWN